MGWQLRCINNEYSQRHVYQGKDSFLRQPSSGEESKATKTMPKVEEIGSKKRRVEDTGRALSPLSRHSR